MKIKILFTLILLGFCTGAFATTKLGTLITIKCDASYQDAKNALYNSTASCYIVVVDKKFGLTPPVYFSKGTVKQTNYVTFNKYTYTTILKSGMKVRYLQVDNDKVSIIEGILLTDGGILTIDGVYIPLIQLKAS